MISVRILKHSLCVVALTCFGGSALSETVAMSVKDFLTPPSAAKPLKSRTLKGAVRVDSGGPYKGKEVSYLTAPVMRKGTIPYRLNYHNAIETAREKGYGALPREGYLGIGLQGPSNGNFYGGGFINVKINGLAIAILAEPEIVFHNYADRDVLEAKWKTQKNINLTLVFTVVKGDDKLLITGKIDAGVPVKSVTMDLRCYPNGFKRPLDRWIRTAAGDTQQAATVTAKVDDCWIFYFDKKADRAVRKNGLGPCALMYVPEEVQKVVVKVTGYPICTSLTLNPDLREFHVSLWEFGWIANDVAFKRFQKSVNAIR